MSSPQLERIVADLVRAQRRLDALRARVPDERWTTRPRPDAWSIAECVEHLNLTGRAYLPRIRAALDEARRRGGAPPARYRRDAIGWLIGTMSGPRPRFGGWRIGRVRTTAAFVPGPGLNPARLVEEFAALQAAQIDAVRAAEGLPIDRVKVVSPFDSRIRYNLYSCLVLLPGHQHRHLDQAEEVRAR